jgi:hypothetical protein
MDELTTPRESTEPTLEPTVEPVGALPSPHVGILRRVGVVLLSFFALHLLSLIIDLLSDGVHSYSLDVLALILGVLLFQGSLGAARFTAFAVSFHLAGVVGMIVVVPLVCLAIIPSSFWHVAKPEDWAAGIGWMLFVVALEAATSLWMLRELRRDDVADALARAQKKPLTGLIRLGAGLGAGTVLLIGVLFLSLAPLFHGLFGELEQLTEVAKMQARAQLGEGYDVSVTSINSSSHHWRAHIVARRGSEVKELDLTDLPEEKPAEPSQP